MSGPRADAQGRVGRRAALASVSPKKDIRFSLLVTLHRVSEALASLMGCASWGLDMALREAVIYLKMEEGSGKKRSGEQYERSE